MAILEAMNAYRQLTQDANFGARAEGGKAQLVYVTCDPQGNSTVEPRSRWMPTDRFVSFMRELCADELGES